MRETHTGGISVYRVFGWTIGLVGVFVLVLAACGDGGGQDDELAELQAQLDEMQAQLESETKESPATTSGPDATAAPATAATTAATAAPTTAAAPAANPDLSGDWTAIDTDGSRMWLFVDRVATDRFEVTYYDDGASMCGDWDPLYPAKLESVGTLTTAGDLMLESASFTCLAGADREVMDAVEVPLFYDAARGVIVNTAFGYDFERSDFYVRIDPADFYRPCDDPASRPDAPCLMEQDWDYYGYEDDPAIVGAGATHTHAYGSGTGFFIYRFHLPFEPVGPATISARLSSEFPGYEAPPDGSSDIEVMLNGESGGTQRVIPDDGSGEWYTWSFDTPLLDGFHTIVVQDRQADPAFRNGLAIYGYSLVPGEDDAGIFVSVDR